MYSRSPKERVEVAHGGQGVDKMQREAFVCVLVCEEEREGSECRGFRAAPVKGKTAEKGEKGKGSEWRGNKRE